MNNAVFARSRLAHVCSGNPPRLRYAWPMAKAAFLVALAALIALPVSASRAASFAHATPETGTALGNAGAGAASGGANSGAATPPPAERIRVLAAADLQPVLLRLIAAFASRVSGVAGRAGIRDHDGIAEAGRDADSTGVAGGRGAVRIPERADSAGIASDGDVARGRGALASQGMAGHQDRKSVV